jgi:hypothetical protein
MEARELRLVIPGDASELSPNKRLHHHARARLVKMWRERAYWYWTLAGRPYVGERVVIAFTVRRGRALDPDNCQASGCLKSIVDGLSGFAFGADDVRHVRFDPITQESGKAWSRSPEVVVVIRPDENAAGPSAIPAAGAQTPPERPA